jgi:hypothetical protein
VLLIIRAAGSESLMLILQQIHVHRPVSRAVELRLFFLPVDSRVLTRTRSVTHPDQGLAEENSQLSIFLAPGLSSAPEMIQYQSWPKRWQFALPYRFRS